MKYLHLSRRLDANTGHGPGNRVKHCYNHTHTHPHNRAHIGLFSPQIVSELPVIMTRGHEMLAAATKA